MCLSKSALAWVSAEGRELVRHGGGSFGTSDKHHIRAMVLSPYSSWGNSWLALFVETEGTFHTFTILDQVLRYWGM